MDLTLPHAIPYQGSKRRLAPLIAQYIPTDVEHFYEPFCGSAAMTIYSAHFDLAKRFILSDTLPSITHLLSAIIEHPEQTSKRYKEIWTGQENSDWTYFNQIRTRFNSFGDPVDLLYLICRCVKNAVRFNATGHFTQSVDKRRLGMRPDKMDRAIQGISYLLRNKSEFRVGDWTECTSDARPVDFIYLDPPYLGTSEGRDKRYHKQLSSEGLVNGLALMRSRGLRFALSYDGMTGEKTYGPPLPDHLGLQRILIEVGRSSQSTLLGRNDLTVESLYVTQDLAVSDERRLRVRDGRQIPLLL